MLKGKNKYIPYFLKAKNFYSKQLENNGNTVEVEVGI